jgi:hypothetical protein
MRGADRLAVTQARPDGRGAVRGAGGDRAGAALALPAQRASMRMGGGLLERVTEHVVYEAQKAGERP